MSRVRMLVAAAVVCAAATMSVRAAAAEAHPATVTTAPAPRAGVVSALAIRPAAGRAEVVITLDGATRVRDFRLTKRDRIVLDISGVKLGLPARRYDRVDRAGIVDVRWSQFSPGVVRVVLTLDKKREYAVERSDSTVTIAVAAEGEVAFASWQVGKMAATVAVAAAPAADTAPTAAPSTETLEDVTPASEVAHHEPARPETAIPVGASPDAVAAPQGAARETAARQVEPVEAPLADITTEEALASTQRERSTMQQRMQQPRISVAWSNADIREVLAQFAAFSGRTIIVGRGVEATVTAEIIDQPWDVAMAAVLASQGLAATEDASGIIVVDTYQNIASRRTSEPLATRTLRLNYARAASVAENLRQRLTRDCSRGGTANARPSTGLADVGTTPTGMSVIADPTCPVRGAVTADSLTNSISITDVPGALTELTAYARSLDIRQPQVAIKAKIVLVDRTSLEALGLKYDLGTRDNFFDRLMPRLDSAGQPVGGSRFLLGGNALAGIANASATVPNPALSLVYSAALGRFDFTTFLDALQETSLLDVQSEPSVVTLNNRTAELRAGVEVPIRVIEAQTGGGGAGNFPRATVQLRQTGIILNVTPQITANRQIIMRVVAENSDVDYRTGDVGAVFPTQRVENELLVADGETAVMGGLTQTRVSVTKTGIPVLVDLPLIGRLFGVTNRQETKRDLLILITPHIVDEGQTVPASPDAR